MKAVDLKNRFLLGLARKKVLIFLAVTAGFGSVHQALGQEPAAAGAVEPEDKSTSHDVRPSVRLELDSASAVLTGQFTSGTGAQTIKFDKPVTGRYFCLETLSAHDGRAYAAVAELDFLDDSGHDLDRSGWKIAYADSEEHEREDGSAENAIDGNPATIWHTEWSASSPNHPHHLVVDFGRTESLAGFRYLPRPGNGMVGGRIKDYRIYVGDNLLQENAPDKTLPDHCYLFGCFTVSGEAGLHLAYSLNGFRWYPINHGHSLLKPEVGDKLMRDPCLALASNGTFHLVWTAAWNGNYIGYASSKDLVHWSAQRAIPVMTNEAATLNCWAPEIFWNQSRNEYLVYWASTVTNKFGGATRMDNNRIYCTTTKDFQTYSPTKLFYNPGYSVVDATLFQNNDRFYLAFKDDSINHLRLAVASSPTGPFGPASTPFETDYAEGPMLFHIGNQVVASYHIIADTHCGAVKTSDMEHWEDISSGIYLPAGSAQGTVLEITGQKLKPLLQAGLLEMGVTPEASELGIGDWIWTTNVTDRQSCHLWHALDVPQDSQVARAELRMTADNSYTLYLDGREIGRGGDANSLAEYDLTWLLTPGHHVLAVEAFNDTLDAGMILGLRARLVNGKKLEVFSDPSWFVAPDDDRLWKTRPVPEKSWVSAQVVGYAGKAWWQHPYKIVQVPPLQPQVVHIWQQAWVMEILLGLCLTVAILWVRQGLRLALQTRAQSLLERERARIARDMHDDLGSGLTQLTLLGELVLRETPPEGEIRNRLNELCARSRVLLRSMDEIVWTVNPRRDTVKDFAAFVSEHAQEFLATTTIRCRQEVMEELPSISLDLPQRRNLLLAVKEAIRNAARHSGADEIMLKLLVADNCLQVVVQDNGEGFDPANLKAQERNGMTNMKQRLADIGGNFTLETSRGQGCRVMFSLPLQVSEKKLKTKP